MKKLLVITLLAASAFTSFSQTNVNPWYNTLWNAVKEVGVSAPTNFAVVPFLDYAPKAPEKWGGGIVGFYNISANIGAGVGVEYMGKQFWMPSGQLELKVPMKPLAFLGNNFLGNAIATPYIVGGVATPLGGAGNANGNLGGIAGAGACVDLCAFAGGEISVGGGYIYWSNVGVYSGNHYQGFLAWRKGF